MNDHSKILAEIALVQTIIKLAAQEDTLRDAQTIAHAMIFQDTSGCFYYPTINEYCLYLIELNDVSDKIIRSNSENQISEFKAEIEAALANAKRATAPQRPS